MADDDLSDDQLQQLLKDAEQRLRAAKGKGVQETSLATLQRYVAQFPLRPLHVARPPANKMRIQTSQNYLG